MLVDLILMRRDGVKLTPEELRAAVPLRGHLTVRTDRHGPLRRPDLPPETTSATLTQEPGPAWTSLASLEGARVTTLKAGGMVLVGLERHGHPTMGRQFPQAWWCRHVHDGGVLPLARPVAAVPAPDRAAVAVLDLCTSRC